MLTAIATAIKSRQPIEDIVADNKLHKGLFTQNYPVVTNNDQAGRLMHYLQTSLSDCSLHYIMYAMLSESKGSELLICNYIQHSLKRGRQIDRDEAHPAVRAIHDQHYKVSHEVCHMKGFVRFRMLKKKLLYAPIEPDHNIIVPVAQHFQERLRDEQWIIHDLKRNIALMWDGELQSIEIDDEFTDYVKQCGSVSGEHLDIQEKYYQDLWKMFHRTVAIEDRINPSLQRQFMPKRYWKYLVEV